MLIESFLDGAAPLRQLLVEGPDERAAILDELADFLLLLRDTGVVHADLQWNNILVHLAPAGRQFHLVDVLHVRLRPRPDRAAFAKSLAWFVAFMMADGAAREVVEEFLDRLPRLGLDRQADRREMAERARGLALQLRARPSYERFKGRYDSPRAAAAYRDERFSRSRRWRRIDRRERQIVGRLLSELPKGAWLLDLPCGAGRLAPLAGLAGLHYVGADVSPEMVQLARQVVGELGRTLAADGTSLPFADGAFEAALCVRLMHRIVEREARVAILCELARCARRRVVVSYYCRWNWRGLGKWLRGRFPGLALADIYEDVGQAGLRVVAAVPLGRWTEQQWFFVLERRGGV
jgi:SAM-dependent methyltransferase